MTSTTDRPWPGDAVSLVEAFRSGDHSPLEELEATIAAIEADQAAGDDGLNAVCHLDLDAARAAAAAADVSLPFGGVPMGIKELDHVAGWPLTEGSVALADRVAEFTQTKIDRLLDAGAVAVAQTTSSEFGGVNQTFTKLHGATRNPWGRAHTPGGSSGGSAAGVSGGLFTLATASDGGGSIRIPAGFCGLVGLKPTWGRVPRGPHVGPGNLTSVSGCVSRSVRDTARWFDVQNGFDPHDPLSLPRVEGWEAGLGSHAESLRGRRAAVVGDLGHAVVADETVAVVEEAASWLISALGLRRVEGVAAVRAPVGVWGMTGTVGLLAELGDRWPERAADLTGPMRVGLERGSERWNLAAAARAETERVALNEAMAALFAEADLVFAPTNPHTAFGADTRMPAEFGGKEASLGNHGALTIPANIYGNPAISIPIGTGSDGLPIGLQVMAPHHAEPLLLDVALTVERERPWPLMAPGSSYSHS